MSVSVLCTVQFQGMRVVTSSLQFYIFFPCISESHMIFFSTENTWIRFVDDVKCIVILVFKPVYLLFPRILHARVIKSQELQCEVHSLKAKWYHFLVLLHKFSLIIVNFYVNVVINWLSIHKIFSIQIVKKNWKFLHRPFTFFSVN